MLRRSLMVSLLLAAGCVDLTLPPPLQPGATPGPDSAQPPQDSSLPDLRGPSMDVPQAPDAPEPEMGGAGGEAMGGSGGGGGSEAPDMATDAADDLPPVPDMMIPDLGPDAPIYDDGHACLQDSQCQSKHCAQGFCCNVECNQACFTCNIPMKEGLCLPVPNGQVRQGDCNKEEATTCGLDGTCDGAGHCRRYQAGTECSKVSCTADTEHAAGACDGQGHCQPGATMPCSPNTCMGDTCAKTCGPGAPCQKGFFCDSTNHCAAQRRNGQGCTGADQCGSGNCVDTVCCDTPCTQKCFGCNIKSPTDLAGTCSPAPVGQDPHNECPAEDPTTCGRAGGCGMNQACRVHPMGTVCKAQTCTSSVQTNASTCNGLGACVANGTTDCGNYLCNGTACRTTCTVPDDCKAGLSCTGNKCGLPPVAGEVLYWRLDEASGTTAMDSSGNALNGTYAGAPVPSMAPPLAPLMFPNARYLVFNAANRDAVHVPMTAALKPANNITVSAWYRATAAQLDTGGGEVISGGNAYVLRVRATQLEISKRVNPAGGGGTKAIQCFSTGVAPATFLDGKWHHLAGSSGSTTGLKLYFDGAKVCDQATGDNLGNIVYQGPDFWAGRHGNLETQWDFGGALDEVRFYPRVLSDAEVMSLAQGAP